jgi:hypothetical protein
MNSTMKKIGRNERCPCGSGKKYKQCHLAADEQRRRESIPAPAPAQTPAEPPRTRANIADLPVLLKQLSKTGPDSERAKFTDLLAKVGPVLAYVEKQAEIEAAAAALEAHQAEFEQKLADRKACQDWAATLFAEECFAPLRFTAADLRRAFDQVGYPANVSANDRTQETLRAAILFLADQECRIYVAMSLNLHLPAFVAAGRYLDAWLIQHCAYETTECGDQSNPFLYAMFAFGYTDWMTEQRAKGELALRKMGLAPEALSRLGPEGLDDWIQSAKADSALGAQIEAMMEENPDLRGEAIANLEAMEHDSVKLLDRPDAGSLLLAPAEVAPWLEALNQRLEQAAERWPPAPDGTVPPAVVPEMFKETMLPALREMAAAIFTPTRLQQLLGQIKEYRRQKLAADDQAIAGWAMGAIASLERETDPGQNYFLTALCLASLKPAMAE